MYLDVGVATVPSIRVITRIDIAGAAEAGSAARAHNFTLESWEFQQSYPS